MHTDIRKVAIPIIGSGEYGFPFELALRIVVATIGNALVEWEKADEKLFEMAVLERIHFYVYHQDEAEQKRYYSYAPETISQLEEQNG